MKKYSSLFLFLVTALALVVTITGMLAKMQLSGRIFQILFVPVTFYLSVSLIAHLLKGTPPLERKIGWQRVLIYYSFIVTITMVVVSFLSSDTFPEIVSSLIFSPLAIYFLILVLPAGPSVISLPVRRSGLASFSKSDSERDNPPQLDVNRRDFLKLIGTAGILTFIFNLFTKRTTIPFFANIGELGTTALKNTSGSKIDPAEKSPTDGYYISEVDDTTNMSYFGFVNKNSQWYIMREEPDGNFRYIRGGNQFSSSWAQRESLNYDRFDKVFSY